MNNKILKDMVAYIDVTQDELEKYASYIEKENGEKAKYFEKVSHIVDKMVDRGEVPSAFSEIVKQDFTNNPIKLAEYLINRTGPEKNNKWGEPSGFNKNEIDPVIDFCFNN
jgi:hypothetical protein